MILAESAGDDRMLALSNRSNSLPSIHRTASVMGHAADCLCQSPINSARPTRRVWGAFWLALFACSLFAQTGCVHRRLTIQSDPPNALVLIDGHEKGYTPYSMDYTYYGTREIQLVKPGYETLTVMQKVPKPWYQCFPIEFFADNLWPCKTTDRNNFFYRMQPKTIPPVEELLDRAGELRTQSQIGR